MGPKNITVSCQCASACGGVNVMTFEAWKDEPQEVYIDIMKKPAYGRNNLTRKIKLAYSVLFNKGESLEDVCIGREGAIELRDYLNDILKE